MMKRRFVPLLLALALVLGLAAPAVAAQEPEAEKAADSDDAWDILERIFNRKR